MDNFLFLPRATAAACYDVLFAALTGLLLCASWLPAIETPLRKRLHRTLLLYSTLLLLALLEQIWLVTATMLGTSAASQVVSALHDVLATTHAGRAAAAAIVPAIALLILACLARRRFALLACWLPLIVLGGLRSATGHAAANGDFTLDEAAQLLHLAATAVWAGTILAAALLFVPQLLRNPDATALTAFGHRLSRYATAAIVLVIATGIYKSWRGLGGSLTPLAHTQWGILLTVKSALVLLALLTGLYNRLLLRRNPTLIREDALAFLRGLRLETLLMAFILTLSAFLANSPPATSL